jgi:hypothetical protein
MVDYAADRFHPSRFFFADSVLMCDFIWSSIRERVQTLWPRQDAGYPTTRHVASHRSSRYR